MNQYRKEEKARIEVEEEQKKLKKLKMRPKKAASFISREIYKKMYLQ